MNKKKIIKRTLLLTIIFICLLSLLIIRESNYVKDRLARTELVGGVLAAQIEDRLGNEIGITEVFKILMEADEATTLEKFDNVACELFKTVPELNSIQLAPKGVVTYVYPQEGNETGKIDLFADSERKDDAIKARDGGNIVITGPAQLKQGGMGLIAGNPVFLDGEF